MTTDQPYEDLNEDNSTGISWDARQGRSKVLLNLLIAAINQANTDNYSAWLRSLKAIHWLCSPYVKATESDKIRAKLVSINHWLNQKGTSRMIISCKLDELMEDVMTVYRNQFMQSQEDNSDKTFNPADILGF
jgi:hypothetical protein